MRYQIAKTPYFSPKHAIQVSRKWAKVSKRILWEKQARVHLTVWQHLQLCPFCVEFWVDKTDRQTDRVVPWCDSAVTQKVNPNSSTKFNPNFSIQLNSNLSKIFNPNLGWILWWYLGSILGWILCWILCWNLGWILGSILCWNLGSILSKFGLNFVLKYGLNFVLNLVKIWVEI